MIQTAAPLAHLLRACWRLVTLNRKVTVGAVIVGFFLLLAIVGPLFAQQDATGYSTDILEPPSATHWLGTNQIGQDVFTQVVVGARASIALGFIAGTITTLISVVVGLVSGYFGGWLDEVFSLITNVFLVLPTLPLAILLAVYLPAKATLILGIPYNGTVTLGIVIVVTGWSWGARVMRAQTLSVRNREYVETALSRGEGPLRIIFFEIFPNEIALVAAELLGTVIYAILAETGLEYIGLGNLSGVSWGTMLFFAQNGDALLLGAWWWFLPPGLCIAVLGAGLALLNFGIDEVANPRLRKVSAPKRALRAAALKLGRARAVKEEVAR